MPEATIPRAAKVEVKASHASGLTVVGVTKDQIEVQRFMRASGLKWSSRQHLWYLPNSRGDQFNHGIVERSRRLSNQLSAEFRVPVAPQLDEMNARQSSEGVGPAAVPHVPAIDSEPVREQPDGVRVGSRYADVRDLGHAVVTARVRADIVKAKREGLLPVKLVTSVVKREYSGGWAIDVVVKHWANPWQFYDPQTSSEWRDPEVDRIMSVLTTILSQYNRTYVDHGSDYPHKVWFHHSVTMDWRTCCDKKVLASPSHPVFQRS